MPTKDFLRPFQYEKIPLEELQKEYREERRARAKNTFRTIKRVWDYLAKQKLFLTLVIIMVMISSAMSLLGPYLVGISIDKFIEQKQTAGLSQLLVWLGIVYILHSLSVFLQNYWVVGIAQDTVYQLRADLFHKFHRLPISYFDEHQHGELMSRVTNDIDNINNTLNQSITQIFASVLTLLGTVIVMISLSPILTVITMTIIPVMFVAMRWITNRTRPLYKLQQKHLGEVNGYVEEIISGQHVVKAFSQEKRVIQEFKHKNNNLQLANFWSMLFAGYIPKVMNMLNFLGFGLIALFGGILAINQLITVGVIVIFTEYARQFTRPLNELSNQFNILLSAIAGAERVFSVIDQHEEEDDETDAISIDQPKGHFSFENIFFSYEDTPTLQNITFEVYPGDMIAFVGHTGAGKSTLIHLISRFYNYDSGEIRLDGIPLKDIKRSSLRKHMGFVLQDPFLFHGTIRENIRYGKLHATDEEVVQAAKHANAHEFIMRLPNGYDTVLDQEGSGISQGQKQLLTIARALLADPSILVLDEATSNIDTITELKIQDALHTLMEGRTSFVIAHRLNTIQEADQIIMLENGKIIEQGDHKQLMDLRGHYYNLYKEQLKKQAS